MIKRLELTDVPQVAKIHQSELSGFLPELGEEFLQAFYKSSLYIPEMFTCVEKENDQILGFVTGTVSTEGLYKKIIVKDILRFVYLFSKYLITHPSKIVKMVKTLTYPGFKDNSPELLTIAVSQKFQKKGIGRILFLKVAETFQKKGIRKFKVSVYDRLSANGFYKRMGCRFDSSFDFLGERMNYYSYEIR